MPGNRLEELALHFEGKSLTPEMEQELLEMLSDPDKAEFWASNFYVHRLLIALNPASDISARVMHLVRTSSDGFEEELLRRIENDRTFEVVRTSDRPLPAKPRSLPQKTPELARQHRPSDSTRWAAILSVAASVLILIGLATFFSMRPFGVGADVPIAKSFKIDGEVMVVRDGHSFPVTSSFEFFEGDIIKTMPRGRVHLVYPKTQRKVTSLVVEPASVLSFNDHSLGKQLNLMRGKISADVAPQKHPMTVISPNAIATVLGTEFSLNVEEGQTRLEVTEGKVKLQPIQGEDTLFVEANRFGEVNGQSDTSLLSGILQPAVDTAVTAITGFSLVDSEGRVIPGYELLNDEVTVRLSSLKNRFFGIQANFTPGRYTEGSIDFILSNGKGKRITSRLSNFTDTANENDNVISEEWRLTPGRYRLVAQPYSLRDKGGDKGESNTISVHVLP